MNRQEQAVLIADYDPSWPLLYAEEERWLRREWSGALGEVHHVGSTAVPGLAAKPIIDILVLLDRFPLAREEIEAAVSRGFEYRGEQGIPGREYFSRRDAPAAHIHAFHRDHPEGRLMLAFRDYLRAHPEAAREYEGLKRRLAVDYAGNRPGYTDAKEPLVREALRLAGKAS